MSDSEFSPPGIFDFFSAPREVASEFTGKVALIQVCVIYAVCLWLVFVVRGSVSAAGVTVALATIGSILVAAVVVAQLDFSRMYKFLIATPSVLAAVSLAYYPIGMLLSHSQLGPVSATAVIASFIFTVAAVTIAFFLRTLGKRVRPSSRTRTIEEDVLDDDFEDFDEI